MSSELTPQEQTPATEEENKEYKRKSLRAKIEKIDSELAVLKKDYSLLVEAQLLMVKMYTVAESTEHSLSALNYSLNNITDTFKASNIEIPNMEKLMDFEDFLSEKKYIDSMNSDFLSTFKTKSQVLDDHKKTIANKIAALVNEKAEYEFQLNELS